MTSPYSAYFADKVGKTLCCLGKFAKADPLKTPRKDGQPRTVTGFLFKLQLELIAIASHQESIELEFLYLAPGNVLQQSKVSVEDSIAEAYVALSTLVLQEGKPFEIEINFSETPTWLSK